MKRLSPWICALALVLPGLLCPAPAPAAETPTPPDPITEALAAKIAGKAPLDDVRVVVKWTTDAVPEEAKIFGRGVGIWDGRLQFYLSKPQVISVLEALQKARFGSMPGRAGDIEPSPGSPLRLVGSIEVSVGPQRKLVVQVDRGEQSKRLAALARETLGICRVPGQKGAGATSLSDALRKLAAGDLAPEAFEALVQRRASRSEPGSPQDSWVLRVEGRSATNQEMPRGRMPESPKSLTLSLKDYEALIAMLISNELAAVPKNVYTAQYTDLSVEVLDQRQSIVGRRFAGKSAEEGSPRRQQFDRIYEGFRALRDRVEKEGTREEEKTPKSATSPRPSPSPSAP